jgi:carbon storage regulator
MLVLTRKVNEAVCIGSDVEVIVLAVKGNQVRIGINAPRNIIVDRVEVAERKRRERGAPVIKRTTTQVRNDVPEFRVESQHQDLVPPK